MRLNKENRFGPFQNVARAAGFQTEMFWILLSASCPTKQLSFRLFWLAYCSTYNSRKKKNVSVLTSYLQRTGLNLQLKMKSTRLIDGLSVKQQHKVWWKKDACNYVQRVIEHKFGAGYLRLHPMYNEKCDTFQYAIRAWTKIVLSLLKPLLITQSMFHA